MNLDVILHSELALLFELGRIKSRDLSFYDRATKSFINLRGALKTIESGKVLPKFVYILIRCVNPIISADISAESGRNSMMKCFENGLELIDANLNLCGNRTVEALNAESIFTLLTSITKIMVNLGSNSGHFEVDLDKMKGLNGGAESLVICCLKCLSSFFRCPSDKKSQDEKLEMRWKVLARELPKFMNGLFLPQMAHILVGFSNNDIPSKEIKLSALNCLIEIMHFVRNEQIWVNYFPGIGSCLYELCLKGQNDVKIVEKAVHGYSALVRAAYPRVKSKLNDENSDYDSKKALASLKLLKGCERNEVKCDKVDGLEMINVTCCEILERSLKNKSWKVRKACLEMSLELLSTRQLILENKILKKTALDTIISLTFDENAKVSEYANLNVERFKNEEKNAKNDFWAEMLDEAISLAKSISEYAKSTAKESEMIPKLNLLSGYLSNFNQKVSKSGSKWQQIFDSVSKLFEYDDDDKSLLILSKGKGGDASYYQRTMKHSREPKTIFSLQRVCLSLGKCADFWTMSEILNGCSEKSESVEKLSKRERLRLASVLNCFDLCLKGFGRENGLTESEGKFLIQVIFSTKIWATCNGSENELMVGQLLGIVGTIFEASSESCGKFYLVDALYPIVEKLSHSRSVVISQGASATLQRLSLALHYADLREMIRDNMDYIVDQAILSLENSRGFPIFSIKKLLRFIGPNLGMNLLHDLVGTVINNLDRCLLTDDIAFDYLEAMQLSVDCIEMTKFDWKAKGESEISVASGVASSENESNEPSVGRRCCENSKRIEEANGRVSSTSKNDNEAKAEEDESEKDKLFDDLEEKNKELIMESKEMKTVVKILQRSQHLLSFPSIKCRVLASNVILACLKKLDETKHEEILLPHVHKAWPFLMKRLNEFSLSRELLSRKSPSFLIIRAKQENTKHLEYQAGLLGVLETISSLVDLCGDFLALKFKNDLWPVFRNILSNYKGHFLGSNEKGKGRQSLSVKIFNSIFLCLDKFASSDECVHFIKRDALEIAEVSSVFLNTDDFPCSVALSARKLMASLDEIDAVNIKKCLN